jgi:hypothetical protein
MSGIRKNTPARANNTPNTGRVRFNIQLELDRILQSISWPSEGEAVKRLHGKDCAESIDILEAQ